MNRFFRFSLGSFVLAITLACVGVSHYSVSRQNRDLSEENRKLKEVAGYITVDDPEMAYVMLLESGDPLTWRCRVYLPPGKKFSIWRAAQWVQDGWPESPGGGSGPTGTGEQFLVTVAMYRDAEGWGTRVSYPNGGGSSWSRGHDVEWLGDHSSEKSNLLRHPQQEFDPSEPIPLLRWRAYQGGKPRAEEPGFTVWLEPKNAAPQTTAGGAGGAGERLP